MNLSFLYNSEDSQNLANIYEELQKVENLEVFHNNNYLVIYFNKGFFKIGKNNVNEILKKYKDFKLVRHNNRWKIRNF